jgi:hypothetical protein
VRRRAPFQPADLAELDVLLDRALAVVPMDRVHGGMRDRQVIGLRHDVDNAIEPAVAFARWEEARGYRSTYFILHTAPYWADKGLLRRSCDEIAALGHEIGLHNNAIAASLMTGRDPCDLLDEAAEELRGYGYEVTGTVAHGDRLCRDDRGHVRFVNDEIFVECERPTIGEQGREIGGFATGQAHLADFGFDYEANWVCSRAYLSDSGGVWNEPGWDETLASFPFADVQLQMLVHPDWWGQAFVVEKVPA